MKKSTISFKVVLPLAVGGESDKYPQKFSKLGVEFVNQRSDVRAAISPLLLLPE